MSRRTSLLSIACPPIQAPVRFDLFEVACQYVLSPICEFFKVGSFIKVLDIAVFKNVFNESDIG